ncbi:M14 family zinc carboxypeptidase [Bacteroidota bacterium]
MKIWKKRVLIIAFLISAGMLTGLHAQDSYKTPADVNKWISSFAGSHSKSVKVHKLAVSPGGTDVNLLEIGTEINSKTKTKPAVLLVANMNGMRPLTTEGAVFVCEQLLADEALVAERTWYVLPLGNPDAATRFFAPVKMKNSANAIAANNDLDENTDEDDFNDLNKDGYITVMRQKHPEGKLIVVSDEPRLMRQADPKEGETGVYRIITEGLDDDEDGKYNEDGAGGTNVNLNFPHLFDHFDVSTGLYPGSTPESRGILEFVYLHPEIAMAVAFGETNFCYSAPKGGRTGDVDLSKIKIPQRFASMFGADPDKTYTMDEVIEMVKPLVPPGMEVNESLIAGFLGLGAVINPLREDLAFYNKFIEEYKEYLKEKGVESERFDPEKAKDGSFELWAYYHLGLPVFSMDLFSVPKPEEKKEEGSGITLESIEKMSKEEFIALGEEKISAFLKESGVPEQMSAARIIGMMNEGQVDTKQMVSMMKQMPKQEKDEKGADKEELAKLQFSDEVLGGKGFVNWEPFNHPQLGEVEIGGFVPFMETAPPYEMADSLLTLQIPWILQLADKLPDLNIKETKVTSNGGDIYKLEVWIENTSYLPFPIAMGQRNSQPAPAILLLEGENFEMLEGYKRTSIPTVAGHGITKRSWLIKADKKTDIDVKLTSKSAGNDVKTINIGG